MARRWTDDFFGQRLRAERKHRGWSQIEMAKMLSDKGTRMEATIIAKIEAAKRSVRIDEALAISDLFDVSLDGLLGRTSNLRNDRAYALRALADTADRSKRQALDITIALGEGLADVLALGFDFDERQTLQADCQRAIDALRVACLALTDIANHEQAAH
jgi:transcriptional regulator with XRE-family HTH domain